MTSDKYSFVRPEISLSETICQYMDLDYLLLMLSTGKYFVRYKGGFSDKDEATLPIKDVLPIHQANQKPDKERLEQDMRRFEDKLAAYKELRSVPTSCWTLRNSESSLMWSAYTSKIGVCIKSTVASFISAVDYTGYELFYGLMSYHGFSFYRDDECFSKSRAFADEKELRFYFLSDKEPDTTGNGVSFTVKPCELIKEVILSPRIAPKAAAELCEMMRKRYDIKVSASKIRMND